LIRRGAQDALDVASPRTFWQRLPLWPGIAGRMLIRSQGPDATRKFTAPSRARPVTSDIPMDVIERFHDRRHLEQARSVIVLPGFPGPQV
jgi:hypothetical protein